jgi:hypothetical protein
MEKPFNSKIEATAEQNGGEMPENNSATHNETREPDSVPRFDTAVGRIRVHFCANRRPLFHSAFSDLEIEFRAGLNFTDAFGAP